MEWRERKYEANDQSRVNAHLCEEFWRDITNVMEEYKYIIKDKFLKLKNASLSQRDFKMTEQKDEKILPSTPS